MANRSIGISLDEQLLAPLDAQGANRSALVSEALQQWLARRRLEALDRAYADLAGLESGDLAAAGDDAVAMGLEALEGRGVAAEHGASSGSQSARLPAGSQFDQWP